MEFCAECGEFVDELDEVTGWCNPCSGVTPTTVCKRCSTELDPIHDRVYCASCRYVLWLERNADEIERMMVFHSVDAKQAKEIVRVVNRPDCLSCKHPIKGGQKGKHYFCRKLPACKTAHNSYHFHRRVQNRTHDESVRRALIAATIVRTVNGDAADTLRNQAA